jgi:hypothetical protein
MGNPPAASAATLVVLDAALARDEPRRFAAPLSRLRRQLAAARPLTLPLAAPSTRP